jgi:hypothetical protein
LLRIALIFIAILASFPAAAQSETEEAGLLHAYACEKLVSPSKIDIQLLDDTPRNVQLKNKLKELLVEGGNEATAKAPLVLTLDIKTVRELPGQKKQRLTRLRFGGGVSVRGKIWSNSKDSLLGGRKKSSRPSAVDMLEMTVNINRRNDGRCIWQGQILYDLRGRDPERVAAQLIPILARAMGKTIKGKSIILNE